LQGRNYLREGNYAKAYLLLLRYSSLYLGNVAKHPDAKTPQSRSLLKPTRDRIPSVFDQLEKIKPYIVDAFSEWQRMEEISQAQHASSNRHAQPSLEGHARRDAALSWNSQVQAQLVDASENQDLAVDLATKELAARKASRRAYMSKEEEQHRRTAGFWDGWDRATSRSVQAEDEGLRYQMEAARRRLDDTSEYERDHDTQAPISANYNYPSIFKSTPVQYEATPARTPLVSPVSQPPRPPKEYFQQHIAHEHAPIPPAKQAISAFGGTHPEPAEEARPPTPPPKSLEAPAERKRITFRPAGYLENGEPVRPVFLPESLRMDFVRLAADNTRRGVEMCGLLCGTSVNNALFITCLLIPEQRCTPDTCETTNEGATFDYMDKEDLIQLGWIHTHPTQTCFMSSRDLHTQAGYQVMMPESIAIVCAPRHEPS
jgi:STAM-binding protein